MEGDVMEIEGLQLDATELEDLTAIKQDAPTELYKKVTDIKDEDLGTVDDVKPWDPDTEKPVPKEDDDSGTSFWTWVLWIGGAVLVLALIGGAIYLVMQGRDADKFEHDQQDVVDTEMSNEPAPTHGHHHAHHGGYAH